VIAMPQPASAPREWDADRYDALPLPHQGWGRRTIARLALAGGETVLDAGCGTGRDAELLLQQLPAGRVIALDGSASMLARARKRLAGAGGRVDVVHADLVGATPLRELVAGPVDAIMSVAAFHWVHDHPALFRGLADVLRPGGRFAADAGGAGNIASIRRAVGDVLGRRPLPWYFAEADETRERLGQAGFTDLDVRLRPDPAQFDDPAQLRQHLRTVVLGGHLDQLPAAEHDEFVEAVAARLPEPVVDYVRLEFTAVRA
jgi:trans-aconitate 2-methyltransferase